MTNNPDDDRYLWRSEVAPEQATIFNLSTKFGELKEAAENGYAFLRPGAGDASAVLMATSAIDQSLVLNLMMRMHADQVSKRRYADVFDGNGPLATFSAKIAVSILLGIVSNSAAHDLSIIKSVRNSFAHAITQPHLSSFEACNNLKLYDERADGQVGTERRKFLGSCAALLQRLVASTAVGLAENAVLIGHRDEVLELCRELFEKAFGLGPGEVHLEEDE